MSFEADLRDDRSGFVAEPARPAAGTLVAFGGIRGGMGIPPFEFFRVTEGLDTRRIFARDLRQTWYLAGIEGLGATPHQAAEGLEAVLGDGRGRVVTTGNSAGGFAAIVYGALVGADEVHAFSPQTVLTRAARAAWVDLRWLPEMRRLRRLPEVPPDLLDLRRFLTGHEQSPTIHVHYCRGHRLDARHAERIGDLPGVRLHAYEEGGHGLVGALRDEGSLRRILEEALRGDP